MNRPDLEPWEFEFWTDPVTKRNWLWFGKEHVADADPGPLLDWKSRIFVPQSKASTALVHAALIARNQRVIHGKAIHPEFDITHTGLEMLQMDHADDIVREGALLQLGREKLRRELERAKKPPDLP
jgi:hypothetical protein